MHYHDHGGGYAEMTVSEKDDLPMGRPRSHEILRDLYELAKSRGLRVHVSIANNQASVRVHGLAAHIEELKRLIPPAPPPAP